MKIQFAGLGVTDGRGKIGGNVATKNAYASFARRKVSPINRSTTRQTAIRTTFAFYSSRWSATLTEAQRGAWIAFSAQHLFSMTFGEKRSLKGKEMYIKINQALSNAGLGTIDDPPTSTATGDLGTLSLVANSAGAGTLQVTTNESNVEAGAQINVWATNVVSNGRNAVSNQIRYIGTVAAGASPYDIKSLWTAKWGAFPTVAGGKIVVLLQIINAEGWLGQPATVATFVI